MIGHRSTESSTRRTPAVPVRRALVAAAVIVCTGAAGTTAGFARSTSHAQPSPQTSEYVLPSKQVMREMRAVIIALYGPQPPAKPHCSP
jgi:hypothetical protein